MRSVYKTSLFGMIIDDLITKFIKLKMLSGIIFQSKTPRLMACFYRWIFVCNKPNLRLFKPTDYAYCTSDDVEVAFQISKHQDGLSKQLPSR